MIVSRTIGAVVVSLVCLLAVQPAFSQSDEKSALREAFSGRQYVALFVSDIDQSIAWYQQLFGLEVLDDTTAGAGRWRIANLIHETLHVELIRDDSLTNDARSLGFLKYGFYVLDIDSVVNNWQATTGEQLEILDVPHHQVRLVQFRDPDDNIIQILSDLNP